MQSNDTPVFILQSSTNIDRLVSMYRATKRSKRIFVMDILLHILYILMITSQNQEHLKIFEFLSLLSHEKDV